MLIIENVKKLFLYMGCILLIAILLMLGMRAIEPYLPKYQSHIQANSPAVNPPDISATGVIIRMVLTAVLVVGIFLAHKAFYKWRSSHRSFGVKPPKEPKKRLKYASDIAELCRDPGSYREVTKLIIREKGLTLDWFRESGLATQDLDVLAGVLLEIEAEDIAKAATSGTVECK